MKYAVCEKGRSMVEMMGYLMVVMSVIAIVGRIVAHAFDEHNYSKASVQLSELVGAIAKAAAIETDYSDVVGMINGTYNSGTSEENTLKNAQGLKLIPSSFRVEINSGERKFYHAFGGEVKVSLPPSAIGGTDKFAVEFKGLKRNQCVELAMKDWRQNKFADLYSVIVNSNNYWYWPVYKQVNDNILPVTRAKLTGTGNVGSGQCSAASGNTVMWVFN